MTREITVEAAALDVLDAESLTIAVMPGSLLHSVSILELALPRPSVVTLSRKGRLAHWLGEYGQTA